MKLQDGRIYDGPFGTVPFGYTQAEWIEQLRDEAARLAGLRDDRAAYYRRWAEYLEAEAELEGED